MKILLFQCLLKYKVSFDEWTLWRDPKVFEDSHATKRERWVSGA